MNNLIGINFRGNGKIYFFSANDLSVKEKDNVVVETEKGLQLGTVVAVNVKTNDKMENIKSVIRIATKKDEEHFANNELDAKEALLDATSISKDLGLDMTFQDAQFTLDRKQLLLFFTADSRVDFRELARELASIYKTRIELRQIGVRDKAKKVSGIGQCGRELCCASFLKDSMESVSITMAKNQNIALNPSKINGQCGRLLCCLKYEDDVYTQYRKDLPEVGDTIKTDKGKGVVTSIDILKKSYVVDVEGEGKIEYTL